MHDLAGVVEQEDDGALGDLLHDGHVLPRQAEHVPLHVLLVRVVLAPKDLQNMNFLDATTRIGVDTVSSSLRNANYGLRSEPTNPKTEVSPWMNSDIDPDLARRPLET